MYMRNHRPWRFALFVAVAFVAFGGVTMLLWNWLVPTLFNGPAITFIQALGILVLSKILLSGGHRRHWGPCSHRDWREKLHEHFDAEQKGAAGEDDAGEATPA